MRQDKPKPDESTPTPRRYFLRYLWSGLAVLGAATLFKRSHAQELPPRTKELPAREADFYQPHNLAG